MALLHSPSVPVVGVGASAGGVEALLGLFRRLPREIPASFLVVLHIPPRPASQLDTILQRGTDLRVVPAQDGERIRAGHVYIAAPDRHLILEDDFLRLSRGPRECRARPAIDVLFRSLAVTRGPRAAGVVLSGMLDDGTAGLWAIKAHGGGAFVQDPAEALHPSMPQSAADHVQADLVGNLDALAAGLVAWARAVACADGVEHRPTADDRHLAETRIAAEANALQHGVMHLGRQSRYTCPDCHGVLVEIDEGRLVRFRCHTGHAFSMQTLLSEVDEAIDNGLWDAIRAMEERQLLLRQIADMADRAGDQDRSRHLNRLAGELAKPIQDIRGMVLDPRLFGHASDV